MEYSYVISMDEDQLQDLDEKLKQFKSISDNLDISDGTLVDKINEMISGIGIRSGDDKTSKSIDEILLGIQVVRNAVYGFHITLDEVKLKKEDIETIISELAKSEGISGEIMGTKRINDAVDRLEKFSKDMGGYGSETGNINVADLMADMRAISVATTQRDMFIPDDLSVDLNIPLDILKDPDFFRNVLGRGIGLASSGEAGDKLSKKAEDVFRAYEQNVALFENLELDTSATTAPPHFFEAGMPPDKPTELDENMSLGDWKIFLKDEINAAMEEIVKITEVQSEFGDTAAKAIGAAGWPQKFGAELRRISRFIVEKNTDLAGLRDDTPEETEKRIKSIADALTGTFLDPDFKGGFTIEKLTDLGIMAKNFDWKNEEDIIEGITLALQGLGKDIDKYQDLLGDAITPNQGVLSVDVLNEMGIFGEGGFIGQVRSGAISPETLEEATRTADELVASGGDSPTISGLSALIDVQKDLIGDVREGVENMTSDRAEESDTDIEGKLELLRQQNQEIGQASDSVVGLVENILTEVSKLMSLMTFKPAKGIGRHSIE